MKCYYDILELGRDAEEGQIKAAYKKFALRWHPDKNIDKQEEAKEQFQLVQQAYEVLSDPQERAWYDNHREEILKGRHTDYEEEAVDVFQYFTATCYRGYDKNEPKNFYSVYSDVFSNIFAEDFEYMTEKEIEEVPSFGDADSDFETIVRQFYAYAESYSTKKSYAWLFPHNVSEIKHRKVTKLMDKENKKIQLKARKERNEEVRNLVAFVKKRDRRVAAYKKILEEKAEQNRIKSQHNRMEQIRKREEEMKEQEKQHKSGVLNEGYEEQLKQLESAYSNLYANSSDPEDIDDDSDIDETLYCEACNRLFKDESSFKNHLSSKKHRTNVMLLELQTENGDHEDDPDEIVEDNNGIEIDQTVLEDVVDEKGSDDDDETPSQSTKSGKKSGKKQKSKKNVMRIEPRVSESQEDIELNPNSTSMLGIEKDDFAWDDGGSKKSKKSKNKSNSKKEKITTTTTIKAPDPPVKPNLDPELSEKVEHKCATCTGIFPSKNKLFEHLKKTNHSVYLGKKK